MKKVVGPMCKEILSWDEFSDLKIKCLDIKRGLNLNRTQLSLSALKETNEP